MKKIIVLLIIGFASLSSVAAQDAKVFIHYMGWYGEGRYGRHWIDGCAHEPLIGYYSSKSWSAQLYHILLSWRCGVDGLVINLRDGYDEKAMYELLSTFQRIRDVEENFSYEFAISYDDQGLDSPSGAHEKFLELRDVIMPITPNYLKHNEQPVLFIWNYAAYLSSEEYRSEADAVFQDPSSILIWNELDDNELGDVNAIYPWVQGFNKAGTEWGFDYLNWFYNTAQSKNELDFVLGGVWAGFDDRSCSWGADRYINRNYGQVYSDTWNFVNSYSGSKPMNYVYLETWNDWNEGTEIEPSVEHGNFYMKQSVQYINTLKSSSNSVDDKDFETITSLYNAARMIERGERDSTENYPILEMAIQEIISYRSVNALNYLGEILSGVEGESVDSFRGEISCRFNAELSSFLLKGRSSQQEWVRLEVYDLGGRFIDLVYEGMISDNETGVLWYGSGGKEGIYLVSLRSKDTCFTRKIFLSVN